MRTLTTVLALGLLPVTLFAQQLAVREIRYDAALADNEARFAVDLDLEATGKGESALDLFQGEVAVLTSKLPDQLRLVRVGNQYRILARRAGRVKLKLDLVAKITRLEPWNSVTFTGPEAAIASVAAQASGAGVEVQLLAGTLQEAVTKDGVTRVRGFLGADRQVALRWQSRAAEIARKALVTCETTASVQVTPTVIKFNSQLRYEILQGSVPRLTLTLPVLQAITKLQGEGVRDWRVEGQTLIVEFIRPIEKTYALTLLSEQTLDGATTSAGITPPQPAEVERETGSITVSAEDVFVEAETASGLRQANAPAGAIAAYQFYARPFALNVKLRRIEPVVTVNDRVTVRLEESRLLVAHALTLNVEKAGIYASEFTVPAGFVVADVRGDGLDDWKVNAGKLAVTFNTRLLGSRKLDVQLEQVLKTLPEKVEVRALRATGAVRETAQIGAAAAAGLQLKTAADALTGVREISISRLSNRTDEALAYDATNADWKLTLAVERLAPRITADIFNLVTIGDGLLGGSATIRYAIINQGVQEFRVKVPSRWKNVEFTGPNIRRKEQQEDVWIIGLQEKAWGGYTLVVTYDYQFDPHQAALALGGIHCESVERETGHIAVTSAANLQIAETSSKLEPTDATRIDRIDEAELTANDRSLITRPVLRAYRYAGRDYNLSLDVTRFEELPVLDAVADRTQLTTVLTDAGQMLTQASFMVKNNDRQFQTFTLPKGAELWSCYVGNEAVKPERTGDKLLVPLPRRANRDEAFAVDIVYKQKIEPLEGLFPHRLALAAPVTDMQTTYAEWELCVPETHRLSSFDGNMTVARGTTYGWRDAWLRFARFYDRAFSEMLGVMIAGAGIVFLVGLLIVAIRRGWRGLVATLAVLAILGILAGMLLPSLGTARRLARVEGELSVATLPASGEPEPAIEGLGVVKDMDGSERGGKGHWDLGGKNAINKNDISHGLPANKAITSIPSGGGGGPPSDAPAQIINGSGVITMSGGNTYFAGTTITAGTLSGAKVAGIRPIRIDIPKEGKRFVFTKVLNVGREPLSVRALVMEQATFQTIRAALQGLAFVVGLLLVWWQWRRMSPNTFVLAGGLALAGGAVVSLFLAWRALHVVMIAAVPVVLLIGLIWLGRRLWKRWEVSEPPQPPPIPPAVAAMVLALFIGVGESRAESNVVSILSANYTGSVPALDSREAVRAAQFDAVLTLNATQDNAEVPLFGEEVAVQDFAADREGWFASSKARLVRDGKKVSVFVPRKGTVIIKLKFLVKTTGDVARRQVLFAIPPALSSRVNVTLDEPEAQVEAPTAVSYKSTRAGQQTQVEAVLGAADRVELNWTPRMKRAADVTTTVFCNNAALVTFGGGVIGVRAQLDYQVTQGELRQPRVALPAGQRLMRVEGDAIRTWKLDGQTLNVELVKGVTPSYRLTVETMREEGGGMKDEVVEIPHALDVKRETGLIALKTADEVSVSVANAQELQKVDVDEFMKVGGAGATSAYRFLKPEFTLTVRVAPVEPQVEVTVHNSFKITTEQIGLQVVANYTIKRAGIFTLKLALPAGYRVVRVDSAKIAQWTEKAGELEVTLKERTLGGYALTVDLVKTWTELPKSLQLVGAVPVGAQKVTGFVWVSSEEGVQIKTESFDGITETPVATGVSALGFKLIAAETPGWKLAVTTEKMDSWVRAEVLNAVTLSETLVSGRSVVRFDIANAPTKEFRLRVPAVYRNVEVTGANIRRKDHNDATNEWRIELQNKVRGTYSLTVTWDAPWDVKSGALEIMGVEAVGVERETGAVTVTAPARFRVEAKSVTTDLLKVDVNDLPEWVEKPAKPPVLVFRYLRPGFKLGLATQRFDEAAVLQAIVDNVRLTTVVAEDGQMMTEMALAVRNNARQYLEVTLPEGAEVWSAFVAGQPVRPSRKAGKLLLPMERSDGDATVAVELTYVGAGKFPATRGAVALESPALDVPLKNARWDLYAPPDFRYGDFAGTMKRTDVVVRQAAAKPEGSWQSYSLGDYQEEEGRKQQARKAEVQNLVSNAKVQIASGNLQGANTYANSARIQAGENEELKQLSKDIRRGQALNYVLAQQKFNDDNGSVQIGAQATMLYDEKAAEQQVAKVQAAQEITVARAMPLRVNLPKRGVYLAFSQVLQTEVGKPMTVEFGAVNERRTGWPTRLVVGGAGFLVLWGLVALGLGKRRSA